MVKPLPVESTGSPEKVPRLRDRDKTLVELQLAMHRLQKRQEKASIAAVAREANVTPALIHNRYPDFAEEVRKVNGKATREQRDAKHSLLLSEREKNRRLRDDLSKFLVELQDLASINEGLRQELAVAKAISDGKIARFPQGGKEGHKPVR